MNRMRLAAEALERENKQIQEENRKIQEQNHKNEVQKMEDAMKRAEEIQKMQEENRRIQEENRIIQEKMKVEEAMKRAEEVRVMREENRRIQEESRQNELRRMEEAAKRAEEIRMIQEENRRIQEENRQNELRRMEEVMRRAEETRKIQEETRILQEKIRIAEQERKMAKLAKTIEEDAKKRVEKEICLREEAERNLKDGIPAVIYPTGEEIKAVRERHGYQEGHLHLAITGVSGSGKSSLINAFRGLRDTNKGAAKTGTSETTEHIGRYCDPKQSWITWYDVPGAGTLKVPDWQYFNDQGLYIFDIIIIAVDIRFTKIDVGLLFNCKRFGIPVFVVRSKADQHISNIIEDSRNDDDDDDDESPEALQKQSELACDKFTTETRREFEQLLKAAGLPPHVIYIVSKSALSTLIKGLKCPAGLIDEMSLMKDVVHTANTIRSQFQHD